MKIKYDIKNISNKNKSLCVGDLIKYYGETRYDIIDRVEKLNRSETTKGMVAKLLHNAMNNPAVSSVFDNLEALSKKKVFEFRIDDVDPIVFDNGNTSCILIVEMGEEYFSAKAIYDMMKPGFRKKTFEECVERQKQEFKRWFERNLKEYTNDYSCNVIEG